MIGFLMGKVLFSDNTEVILLTGDGVGHQVYFSGILPEGSEASIYISHVIKEGSQELFGFRSLKEKKFFELLIGVKGVGPKSAFSLMASLNINMIINSILYEDKKTLTKAPGVGPKAAAQIILDLSGKVQKINMYSGSEVLRRETDSDEIQLFNNEILNAPEEEVAPQVIDEAILACKELGFKESEVFKLAQKIIKEHPITKPEQLVHLVLKEM